MTGDGSAEVGFDTGDGGEVRICAVGSSCACIVGVTTTGAGVGKLIVISRDGDGDSGGG